VCIKDHLGLRGDENFPVPGQGQIDHEQLFQTLFSAGFGGPLALERRMGETGSGTKQHPKWLMRESLLLIRTWARC
jgi:sugar phosphate isomerase/epimerase